MTAFLSDGSLFVEGYEITEPDLIHFLMSGEPVPVFDRTNEVGEASKQDDQLQMVISKIPEIPEIRYKLSLQGLINHICRGAGPVPVRRFDAI